MYRLEKIKPKGTPTLCSLQPSPVSSHDPSAAPTIPRAKTRWKEAASAGEQCFGNKIASRRSRIPYTHGRNQLRSCAGKWRAYEPPIDGEF